MITEHGTILMPARLTFHALLKPRLPKNPKPGAVPKYEATVLVPENSQELIEWHGLVDKVMNEKWPGVAANLKPTLEKNKRCWGDGKTSLDNKTMLPREGWVGNTYITARSETSPGVADPTTGQPMPVDNLMAVNAALQKMYSGCYVAVEFKPYCWENENGRGVSADFIGIMFLKDGERMGNAAPAPTGFGAIMEHLLLLPMG